MPAMVKCDRCNALISKSASICPQCHVPVPSNRGACRTCGEALAISMHRYISYVETVSVYQGTGGTRITRFIQHVRCPKCGDPRPLEQLVDKPAAKAVGLFGIILGVIAMVSLPVTLPLLDKPFDSAGRAGQTAIIIGLVVLMCALLGLMGFGFAALNTTNKYVARAGGFRFARFVLIVGVGAGLIAGLVAFLGPQRESQEAHGSAPVSLSAKAPKHSSVHRTVERSAGNIANNENPSVVGRTPPANAVTLRGIVLTETCTIPAGAHVYAKPPSAEAAAPGSSTWSKILIPRIPGCEQQAGRELRLPVRPDEP